MGVVVLQLTGGREGQTVSRWLVAGKQSSEMTAPTAGPRTSWPTLFSATSLASPWEVALLFFEVAVCVNSWKENRIEMLSKINI